MVLKPSDYSLPKMGESIDPTKPTNAVSRVAGMAIVFSVVLFAWNLANNRGAPLIDNVLGSLTGGLISSDPDSGDGMWDGV